MSDKISCSIGVICYNEEANIGNLLDSLLNQDLDIAEISQIIVVSSACTDRTDEIVESYSRSNDLVKLIQQPTREGKSSAINLFLHEAEGDVCIVESGDTLPYPNTVENLVKPFQQEKIGMVGARPIPVNKKDNFMGFVVHLLWGLHHKIAMDNPKLGEMIAFRNVVSEIPEKSAVDEASIEAIIREQDYDLFYDGTALVKNKGAETISDFIKQRRRIQAGHLWLTNEQHHVVSTQNPMVIVKHLITSLEISPIKLLWTIGAVSLEAWGRILGSYDYYIKKSNPYKWEISESTKNLEDN